MHVFYVLNVSLLCIQWVRTSALQKLANSSPPSRCTSVIGQHSMEECGQDKPERSPKWSSGVSVLWVCKKMIGSPLPGWLATVGIVDQQDSVMTVVSPWVSPFSMVPLGPLPGWAQKKAIVSGDNHHLSGVQGRMSQLSPRAQCQTEDKKMNDSEMQWVVNRSGQWLGRLVGLPSSVVLFILSILSVLSE